jgi:hypothetical protein
MTPFDVFNADPFTAVSMSAAIDKMDYVPTGLGSIPGLFEVEPIRTETFWIETRSTGASLIPTSVRGTPPEQVGGDQRDARAFKTRRLAKASRITASELMSVRSFGSEINLKSLQEEVARRQMKLKRDFDLTWENLRMGAVLGKTVDADGSTIYDWAAQWNQPIPAEVDFDLDNASPSVGAVRKKCYAARRSILKALNGVGSATRIVAICGDAFWDDLTSHPEIEKTFLNWAAAESLRNGHGNEWSTFRYGEIDFVNYRGTDDGTTLGVNTDKAKFFPVGAGIFRWVLSPGEKFEHLGAVGQDIYSAMLMDRDRDSWADVEAFSYPMSVCTMPSALYQARRT